MQAQQWFQLYGIVVWGWLISTERDSGGGTASAIWGPPGPFEFLKEKMGNRSIMRQIQEFEADLMFVSPSDSDVY